MATKKREQELIRLVRSATTPNKLIKLLSEISKKDGKLMLELWNNFSSSEKQTLISLIDKYCEEQFIKEVEAGGQRRNKSNKTALKYENKPVINIGFDTEDDSCGNPHLFVFCIEGEEYKVLFNREDAIAFLYFTQFEYDVVLWCVNTEYDLNNLTHGYEFIVNRLYNKSRLIMASLRKINRKDNFVKFYDLINYYSLSAAKVAKIFGLEKHEFDFKKDRKYRKDGSLIVSKKEIDYCKQDTKIACVGGQFIESKINEEGIRLTPTVASAALQIYMKRFDKVDFSRYNKNRYYLSREDTGRLFAGYYGGRTEAFHIGRLKDNIRYFDINSLYPYVMAEYLYPNPYSPITIGRTTDIKNGMVHCRVKVPVDIDIPPLPNRSAEGKLLFPVGTFDGVWTINELNLAKEFGTKVLKVFRSIEYQEVTDLFSEYIYFMYQKRMESDNPADNKFYKILMNSLYGKFGQRNKFKIYVPLEEVSDPTVNVVYDMAEIEVEELAVHTNIIIPAYVTAYGRIELYYWLREVIESGGEVLYCDTDSIIYKGGKELPQSKELGAMKKEADICRIEINGAKYYMYEERDGTENYVCKGVPKPYQRDMFLNGQATYMKPVRYRESLRRKIQANVWEEFTKKSLTIYNKRVINNVGTGTKPIIL